MAQYLINGPSPLRGTLDVSGSRQAGLWMAIASILTEDKVTLRHVPHVRDIEMMLDSLRFLGAEAGWTAAHEVTIHAKQLTSVALPLSLPAAMTTSTLFFAALLARQGRVLLPVNAQEPLRQQAFLEQLYQFGARFSAAEGGYQAQTEQLQSTRVTFTDHSLIGTVLAVLLSVLAEGQTVIDGAATEPEVDDLIGLLNSMGASIMRVDERTLMIDGVRRLHGATHTVMPDPLMVVTYGCATLISGGDVLMRGGRQSDITPFLSKLQQLGVTYQVSSEGIRFWAHRQQKLKPVDIDLRPHPGFLAEWFPFLLPLLASVDGVSRVVLPDASQQSAATLLHQLGLETQMVNGVLHVFGPTPLRPGDFEAGTAMEAAMLTVATLGSQGKSTIQGIDLLDSLLEHPEEHLQRLGAKLARRES
jgi:UDP-N-acetylglucosamine 1-carboxyvinyltransferase